MAALKSYFLVPNYDDFPENGPLFLGSIIANPKMPHKSLNEECRKLPETEHVINGTPFRNWRNTLERGDNGELSIWAKFLHILSSGFTSHYDMSEEDEFQFDLMATQFFSPSDDYLKTAMAKKKVRRHLRATTAGEAEPLYMVIGLKTVTGAKITQKIRQNKHRNGSMGIDNLPGVGAIGGRGQNSSSQVETRTFNTFEPHIIGFRIRKIKINPDKSVEGEDVTEGAYFGVDSNEKKTEASWLVTGLEKQDYGDNNSLKLNACLVLDDQDESCYCIYN